MFGGISSNKNRSLPGARSVILAAGIAMLAACGGGGEDQAVADFPIAYIKRPVPLNPVNGIDELADFDVREILEFNEGGDVYLRDRASPAASERNITSCHTGQGNGDTILGGDVKDLETSYDGTKLIFALIRARADDDEDETWDIYEYDTAVGGCPTRVVADDSLVSLGNDVAPYYLPDGRIVFSSSMQRTTGETLLNEGKGKFSSMDESLTEQAAVLHVMDADGTNIKQISFNQSHDLDASVLPSGEIIFSRWDNAGPDNNDIHLYKIRPDGTGLKALYGVHEHDVGTNDNSVQFLSPRPLEDGRVLAMLKPFNGSAGGGAPVIINVAEYADNSQPIWSPPPNVPTGTGQHLAISQDVRTDNSISPAGRYRSVYPLWDGSNRALVSWTQCRLQEIQVDTEDNVTRTISPCRGTISADAIEAFPVYGIYIYDFGKGTQMPVVIPQEGILVEEPVVLAPRTKPQVLIDKVAGFELSQALATENVGILHIRSVYDFDGDLNLLNSSSDELDELNPNTTTDADYFDVLKDPSKTDADERTARFLRIVKAASIPDPNGTNTFNANVAFGSGGLNGGMREIIGYAPIEPDGSVMTKVPANVPLAISVVDKDGKRIGARHQNWIQVRPGETLECNGCHDHDSNLPHGYSDAPEPLNTGAALDSMVGMYTFPGTNGNFEPQMDETMAEARLRVSCTNTNGVFIKTQTGCPELSPNVNPMFFDLWAQAIDVIADVVDLRYQDLNALMAADLPATAACQLMWSPFCRTVINYKEHIHPLWDLPRQNAALVDMTCTNCHSNQDAIGGPQVPAAQLDFNDDIPRQDNSDRLKSYQELLVRDTRKWQLVGNALEFETVFVQDVDADGNLVFVVDVDGNQIIDPQTNQPIPVGRYVEEQPEELATMRVTGAFDSYGADTENPRSRRFFIHFFEDLNTTENTVNHNGLLTPAEIRLLSEWLDIGAQYYNSPFDAP